MTTIESEWEVGKDSVHGLSCSEKNGCANDSPQEQPQPSPEAGFGLYAVLDKDWKEAL